MSDFGNIHDVASLLGLQVEDVRRLMKRGTLLREKHFRKIGRSPEVFYLPAVRKEFLPKDENSKFVVTLHSTTAIPMAKKYAANI